MSSTTHCSAHPAVVTVSCVTHPVSLLTSSLPCYTVPCGVSLALPCTVQTLQHMPCTAKMQCTPCQETVGSGCVCYAFCPCVRTTALGRRCRGQPWTYHRYGGLEGTFSSAVVVTVSLIVMAQSGSLPFSPPPLFLTMCSSQRCLSLIVMCK